MSALVFLEMNGYDFNASDDELTAVVLLVASGKMLKDELSLFFRQHSRRR
jgi:death-on-curing protein